MTHLLIILPTTPALHTALLKSERNFSKPRWKVEGQLVQGNTSWQMTQFTLLLQARLPHQPRTTLLHQIPEVRFLEIQHKRAAENIIAEMQTQYHHSKKKKKTVENNQEQFPQECWCWEKNKKPSVSDWSGASISTCTDHPCGGLTIRGPSSSLQNVCFAISLKTIKSRLWHYLCSSH